MDEQPINSAPVTQVSKVHVWMIILLVWVAVLSLIAVGLMLTKGSGTSITQSEIATACQNGTVNGITTNLTRIADACQAAQEAKKSPSTPATTGVAYDAVDAQGHLPKLTLPAGWTGSVFINNSHEASRPYYASFHATKGISFDCNECGGVSAPAEFTVTSDALAKAKSMDIAAIQAEYAKSPTQYTNISVSSESVTGGTLVRIDGTFTPDGVVSHAGVFHILRFTNATKFV
mgnify:FL=1